MGLRDALEKQLIVDEGKRLTVYKDPLGNLTVGIGHLVTPDDRLQLGEKISEERCAELFQADLNTAISCASSIVKNFNSHPDSVRSVIVNMIFNLGAAGFSEFRCLIAALSDCDYLGAAEAMVLSRWFNQVGARAKRLASIMASAYKPRGL